MDGVERTGKMSAPNGEDQDPMKDEAQRDRDDRREVTQTNIELMRTLRNIAQEAHAERRRYLAITVTVIVSVFAIRQFLPPAWMLWLP